MLVKNQIWFYNELMLELKKKTKLIYLIILAVSFAIFTCGCLAKDDFGILEIFVFDVGKADAILITTKNHTVMIDTGERRHGTFLVDELKNRGIDMIDYLIITHFDKDHVGGASAIIENIKVKEVVIPDYRRESRDYLNFAQAKLDNGIEAIVLDRFSPLEFILEGISFVTYPSDLEFHNYTAVSDDENLYDDEDDENNDLPNVNNFSLVTHIKHGNIDFLFTGDAKARRIREILALAEINAIDFDFLKVPHHGRFNRRSEEFVMAISPRYAVITCSLDQPADNEIVSLLELIEAQVFFTSMGSIYCRSDGYNLEVTYY